MIKLSLMISTLCVMLAVSNAAYSGNSTGLVNTVTVISADTVTFATAGTHTGKPACSTQSEEWAIPLTTPAGRAMYATLLAAAAQGKTVYVIGLNVCSAWGDRESPSYITVGF